MKNDTNNGITRRSFMKRSTVAAIAAMNMMMFTGLVNAAEASPSTYKVHVLMGGCNVEVTCEEVEYANATKREVARCKPLDPCNKIQFSCGVIRRVDPFTGEDILVNNEVQFDPVKVNCDWVNGSQCDWISPWNMA